ncbi:uncharacterized protein LOC143212000 isoform X3 [Lasioglossum baleicum]|uniref:uncharacterized protein LOC143212000 isoform X3 n=1 Tax=Lasioglossum baleicum TaxID=434251 RepID=UPI003FCEA49E
MFRGEFSGSRADPREGDVEFEELIGEQPRTRLSVSPVFWIGRGVKIRPSHVKWLPCGQFASVSSHREKEERGTPREYTGGKKRNTEREIRSHATARGLRALIGFSMRTLVATQKESQGSQDAASYRPARRRG